jgi:hypothetical protein
LITPSHPYGCSVFIGDLDKNIRFEKRLFNDLHSITPFTSHLIERAIALESFFNQELIDFLFPPGPAIDR